jgi:hypothetical protein
MSATTVNSTADNSLSFQAVPKLVITLLDDTFHCPLLSKTCILCLPVGTSLKYFACLEATTVKIRTLPSG